MTNISSQHFDKYSYSHSELNPSVDLRDEILKQQQQQQNLKASNPLHPPRPWPSNANPPRPPVHFPPNPHKSPPHNSPPPPPPHHSPNHSIKLNLSEQREPLHPNALTARPAHHSPTQGLQHSFSPSQKTVVFSHVQPQPPPAAVTQRQHLQQIPSNQPPIYSPPQSPRTQPQVDLQPPQPPELARKMSTEEAPMQIIIRSPTVPTPPQQVTPPGGTTPAERSRNNSNSNYWQQKYQESMKQLQTLTSELNLMTKKYDELAKTHEQTESALAEKSKRIETLQSENEEYKASKDTVTQKSILITLLRKQNLSLEEKISSKSYASEKEIKEKCKEMQMNLNEKQQQIDKKEKILAEVEEHAAEKQEQLQRKEEEIARKFKELAERQSEVDKQRRRAQSVMRQSHTLLRKSLVSQEGSYADSFENSQRALDLQIAVKKLTTQLGIREETFERELKLSNLKVAEMVDKLKLVTAEKDQTIFNLNEKIGLLQSDLNKRDSTIRNLKDELESRPAKKHPFKDSSVYSSAIMAEMRQGEKDDKVKRELQTLKKSIMGMDRQRVLFQQKQQELQERLLQAEETISNKRSEIQALRRHMNELESTQMENEKLIEVLAKRNAQIVEMKELIMEKEHHTGDYDILSKENQKLRDLMVRKNEEISEIAEKLFHEEKRSRDMQVAYQSRIHQLEDDLSTSQEALHKKQVEAQRLGLALKKTESNRSEIEFELERHMNLVEEYEAAIKKGDERMRECQLEIYRLNEANDLYELSVKDFTNELQTVTDQMNLKQRKIDEMLHSIEQLRREVRVHMEDKEQLQGQKQRLIRLQIETEQQIELRQAQQGYELQIKDNQISQIQAIVRQRESRIHQLQSDVEDLEIVQEAHSMCSKHIGALRDQLTQKQMHLLQLLTRQQTGYSACPPVFENKVIYQLKKENEALKESIRSTQSPSIQGRLNEFHHRLQDVLGQERTPALRRIKSVGSLTQPAFTSRESIKESVKDFDLDLNETVDVPPAQQTIDQMTEFREQLRGYVNRIRQLQDQLQMRAQQNQSLKSKIQELLDPTRHKTIEQYQYQIQRLQQQNSSLMAEIETFYRELRVCQSKVLNSPQKYLYRARH